MTKTTVKADHDPRKMARELARHDLIVFCRLIDPKWKPARFHKILAKKLMKCKDLQAKLRLLSNMPPQHGKSRLLSQLFIAWFLGLHPEADVIMASYNGKRAKDNSLAVRDVIEMEEYQAIFPLTVIRKDAFEVMHWKLTAGGSVRAAGCQGGITGYPANLIVIDDPLSGAEEAQSKVALQANWEFWITVSKTRVAPGCNIIILMTRWSPEDLVGRLTDKKFQEELKSHGVIEEWEELMFKAEAEENDPLGRKVGEYLWPERYDEQHYLSAKWSDLFWWEAMFQQNPRKKGGNAIKVDNIQFIDTAPQGLRLCRFWDLAITEDSRADFTAGVLCGLDNQNNFYILDLVHMQKDWGDVKNVIIDTAKNDRVPIIIESVAGFKIAWEELQTSLMGVCQVIKQTPKGDKLVRTTGWASLISGGKLYMLRRGWNGKMINEIADFPMSKHDDMVDGISGGYNYLKTGSIVTKASYR